MKTEHKILIGFGILAVAFAAFCEARSGSFKCGAEITPEMLNTGAERPPLWVFYNNSQVNSRQWSDFGARSSRVLNIPILNLLIFHFLLIIGSQFSFFSDQKHQVLSLDFLEFSSNNKIDLSENFPDCTIL